jgi:hypothetical protein
MKDTEDQWKEAVMKGMQEYAEIVREESLRIEGFIKDTMKYFDQTLKEYLPVDLEPTFNYE